MTIAPELHDAIVRVRQLADECDVIAKQYEAGDAHGTGLRQDAAAMRVVIAAALNAAFPLTTVTR